MCVSPSIRPARRSPSSSCDREMEEAPCPSPILIPSGKKSILRPRVARRLGQAEVAEGVRGQHAPARGALHEALLDQEWFDDVLDGVARLGERSRDGLDADRAAAERGR